MKVPAAFLLLRVFDATRPGLLVMDADGRRVAAVALKGSEPADLVEMLRDARTAEPTERVFLAGDDDLGELANALRALEGVTSVDEEIDGIAVVARPGVLKPKVILPLIRTLGGDAELRQPAAVKVSPTRRGADVAAAISRVPGTWYAKVGNTPGAAATVWVSRFLLHPDSLEAMGLSSNAVAVRFRFRSLPQGTDAVTHLGTPFEHEGVLAVVPYVAFSTIEVVARRGAFDRNALIAAFEENGLELRGKR